MREMNVIVNGVPATPTVTGLDQFAMDASPITDNGVGDYTINFTKSQFTVLDAMALITMITPDSKAEVVAVTNKSVTVNTFDSDGTTPKDAAFYLCIKGNDHKYNV